MRSSGKLLTPYPLALPHLLSRQDEELFVYCLSASLLLLFVMFEVIKRNVLLVDMCFLKMQKFELF